MLTSWYSGCPVCSGSRAALMTGRQFARIGVPGVFGPSVTAGLPLNETTVADQLKKAGKLNGFLRKKARKPTSLLEAGARSREARGVVPRGAAQS